MDKIYILTIGEYSDMTIYEKACKKEEDADFLASTIGSREIIDIHVLDLYESETIPENFYHDVVEVYINKQFDEYKKCIRDYMVINRAPRYLCNMHCRLHSFSNLKLNLIFYIRDSRAITVASFEKNREEIRKRVTKILGDKIAKLQSLLEIEGWTEEMIKETFNYIEEVKI